MTGRRTIIHPCDIEDMRRHDPVITTDYYLVASALTRITPELPARFPHCSNGLSL
jgi:hypothetical protein